MCTTRGERLHAAIKAGSGQSALLHMGGHMHWDAASLGPTAALACTAPVHVRLKEVKTLRRRPEGQGVGAAGRLFIRALAFDATGSYLAAASDDKSQGMLLWDAATWDQLLAL